MYVLIRLSCKWFFFARRLHIIMIIESWYKTCWHPSNEIYTHLSFYNSSRGSNHRTLDVLNNKLPYSYNDLRTHKTIKKILTQKRVFCTKSWIHIMPTTRNYLLWWFLHTTNKIKMMCNFSCICIIFENINENIRPYFLTPRWVQYRIFGSKTCFQHYVYNTSVHTTWNYWGAETHIPKNVG